MSNDAHDPERPPSSVPPPPLPQTPAQNAAGQPPGTTPPPPGAPPQHPGIATPQQAGGYAGAGYGGPAQPGPGGAGYPAQPTAAAAPKLPDWLRPDRVALASVGGALAVVAAFVAATILFLLTLLAASILQSPSSTGDVLSFLGDAALKSIIWIAVLGLGGQLAASVDASGMIQGSASINQMPTLVFVAVIGMAAWWGFRRQRRLQATRGGQWGLAAVAGVAAGILSILISLVGIYSPASGTSVPMIGPIEATVSTLTFGTFFAPLVFVGLSTVFGSWLAGSDASGFFRALWRAPSRFRWGTRDAYDYIVVLVILFVPVGLIVLLILGEGSATAFPLAGGQVTVGVIALAHLSGVAVLMTGDAASAGLDTPNQIQTLFSDDMSRFFWLPIIAIVAALLASVAIAARRRNAPVPLKDAWTFPVVMALLAVLLGLTFGGMSASVSASGYVSVNISVLIGPAWWTFLIAAVWGGIVEALARFVAPAVITAAPALGRIKLAGGTITTRDTATAPGPWPAQPGAVPPVPHSGAHPGPPPLPPQQPTAPPAAAPPVPPAPAAPAVPAVPPLPPTPAAAPADPAAPPVAPEESSASPEEPSDTPPPPPAPQ